MAKITRALISVSDKTGVIEFSKQLASYGRRDSLYRGYGQTAAGRRCSGQGRFAVHRVSRNARRPGQDTTPQGARRAFGKAERSRTREAMKKYGIEPIDLVVVNLYPFEQTVCQDGLHPGRGHREHRYRRPDHVPVGSQEFPDVTVLVCDPADYPLVLDEMTATAGSVSAKTKLWLGGEGGFSTPAAYDGAISNYLGARLGKRSKALSWPHLQSRLKRRRTCATAKIHSRLPPSMWRAISANRGFCVKCRSSCRARNFLLTISLIWTLLSRLVKEFDQSACGHH